MQKYTKETMTKIDNIGVVMFGLLGDVLIRTPILRALKELYPSAKITGIVDPIGEQILEHNSFIDNIFVVDRKKEKNKFKQNLKKIKAILEVRKQKFDLIVNLYNAGSSRIMVQLSGAKYKLGFCNQEKKNIYNIINDCESDRLKEKQTLYNYIISIIEPLSDKKYDLKPVFDLDGTSEEMMSQYLNEQEYKKDKIYLLNLGASKEDKILENEKYFYIVKYIYEQYGYIPAVISNPGQEYLQATLINDFLQNSKVPYIKLPTLELVDIASLLKLTKFIITPDTGLMHLAMVFDNYIMTIFTYTHPIFVDPKNDKFISVYESFDEGKLYQHQNISIEILDKNIDLLFTKQHIHR